MSRPVRGATVYVTTHAVSLGSHPPFMFRRLVALFVTMCFGLFTVESLVADVHDGDAPASEVTEFGAVTHGSMSTVSAGIRSEGRDTPRSTVTRGADEAVAHATDDHPPAEAPSPGGPAHGVHACHGAHAHVGLSPAHVVTELRSAEHGRLPVLRDTAPPDGEREPQLRPPIA